MLKIFKPIIDGNRATIKKLQQQVDATDDPTLLTEQYMDATKLNETLTEIGVPKESFHLAYKVVDALMNDGKIPYTIGGYNGLPAAKQKIKKLLEA